MYLLPRIWESFLDVLSWVEVWVGLEQALVGASAVVHHCPWCAEWPRASHFSPSRFCLLRDTELWWMVIISPLCGEIVGKEIIFKPLPPKCLSAAVPARSAKLFKLPCLFCLWNLSKYPVPRKRYIWDVNNWNILFLAHRESDTTALP